MARYGLIADIHGNREALAAALAALDERGAERIVCLGDIVGYNADPDECVALVRKRCSVSIAGNHELIGTGRPIEAWREELRQLLHNVPEASEPWRSRLPSRT